MGVLLPNRTKLAWGATAFGSAFGGYIVRRRPRRIPAVSWKVIARITVPSGYTAANVEAQHTSFVDYSAGRAVTGGQWADGWEYYFSALNATTGQETTVTPTIVSPANPPTPDDVVWVVSDVAPWLNFPLKIMTALEMPESDNLVFVDQPAGRHHATTRTRFELPYRSAQLEFVDLSRVGLDPARTWRAAQALGQTMTLHSTRGERIIGTLQTLSPSFDSIGNLTFKTGIIETNGETQGYAAGDYNQPAGLVLNGSSQYASTPDAASINPGTNPFTIVQMAVFPNPAAVVVYLSKGRSGVNQGYLFMHDNTVNVNNFRVQLRGGSANGTIDHNDVGWFDGNPHVAVLTSDGTNQVLYRDGAQVATGNIVHGTISNALGLVAGANNGGADLFSALAPVHAWAYYPRKLTPAEAQAVSYDLLGYPNSRAPYGASVFIELRDARCWNGIASTLVDLSGNGLSATTVASPVTRGIPWRIELLDRFG